MLLEAYDMHLEHALSRLQTLDEYIQVRRVYCSVLLVYFSVLPMCVCTAGGGTVGLGCVGR